MNRFLEITLALRFLFSRRRRRFLSAAALVAILGMAFGVAALFISLSVISGFQKEYKKAILGFNSHLIVTRSDEIESVEEVTRRFSEIGLSEFLVGWTPFIYREGMVISGGKLKGIILKGIDFKKYRELSRIHFSEESAKNTEHLPALILGKNIMSELGIRNDIVKILFPQGLKPEEAGVKNIRRFFGAGSFESGLYEYDSSLAFLNLDDAKKFFQTEGRVSGIEIWLKDPDQADQWADKMREKFEFPYTVMTWRELNENIFKALESEKFIFFLLMIVLIAVASLNILGTLMMLLLEKRGEIAVLRTSGLSWKRIRKIFLFDGLLIGSAGIALGIGIGFAVLFWIERWQPIPLSPEIYFLKTIPVIYEANNFLWVMGSALLLIFLGCELSLRGISRMNVSRALVE